ncbi:hypothetical protein SSS_00851 [Sarcoptes scabiei]|nr:hypothetical protein SSS_00851 [Sarcoptes scabiei]
MAENIHAIISNKHKSSRSISSHPSGDHSDQCSKKIDQTNLNENNFDEDDDIHILGRSTKISVDLNFSSPSPIKPNLSSSNTKTNENNNLALNKNSFADQNNQQSRPKHFNDGNNAFIRDQRASTGSSSSSLLPNESTQQTFHSFTESFFNHSNPIKFSKPNRNMQANEYISPVSPEQDEYTEWETVPRLVATRNRLHRRLCYHFMSPIDKWNIKKRFPWKMLLQAIKIIFVTLQVVLFGNTYTEKLEINDNMLTTIHKTFLLNWDPTRESKSIPPLMPYAVYTIDDIYSHIDNAVINYANITKLSAASFGYQVKKENPFQSSSSEPLRMSIITSCYERYTNVTLNPSFGSYYIDANIIKNCFSIDNIYPPGSDLWRTFSFYQYLQKNHPEQIDLSSLILLSIKFPLRVIVLNTLSMMNLPQCFDLDAEIHFNNKPHTGSIIVNMILKKNPIECKGNLKVDKHHVQLNEFVILLNFSVLIICFCSLLLCLRTLVKNFRYKKRPKNFLFQLTKSN